MFSTVIIIICLYLFLTPYNIFHIIELYERYFMLVKVYKVQEKK